MEKSYNGKRFKCKCEKDEGFKMFLALKEECQKLSLQE